MQGEDYDVGEAAAPVPAPAPRTKHKKPKKRPKEAAHAAASAHSNKDHQNNTSASSSGNNNKDDGGGAGAAAAAAGPVKKKPRKQGRGRASSGAGASNAAGSNNNNNTSSTTNNNNNTSNVNDGLSEAQKAVNEQMRRALEEDQYSAHGSIVDTDSEDDEDAAASCFVYRGQTVRLDRAALQQAARKHALLEKRRCISAILAASTTATSAIASGTVPPTSASAGGGTEGLAGHDDDEDDYYDDEDYEYGHGGGTAGRPGAGGHSSTGHQGGKRGKKEKKKKKRKEDHGADDAHHKSGIAGAGGLGSVGAAGGAGGGLPGAAGGTGKDMAAGGVGGGAAVDPLGLDLEEDLDRDGGSIFGQTTGRCNSTWVECDKCKKWRRLRGVVDEKKLPSKWYCSMNKSDPERSRCSAPEEEYETPPTPESAADARTRKHLRVWVRRLQCNEAYEARQPTLTRGKKRAVASSSKEPYEWVRCCNPSCGKWRSLLRIMDAKSNVIDRTVDGEWYCVMNTWDEKMASCAAPQENLPAVPPPWVLQDDDS